VPFQKHSTIWRFSAATKVVPLQNQYKTTNFASGSFVRHSYVEAGDLRLQPHFEEAAIAPGILRLRSSITRTKKELHGHEVFSPPFTRHHGDFFFAACRI
jgi:hypothetical protein